MLFFYVQVQLKPLVAVIKDGVAHTLWEMEHLATVHKNQGHFHLHAELIEIHDHEDAPPAEKAPLKQTSNEKFSTHLVSEFNYGLIETERLSQSFAGCNDEPVSIFQRICIPPPKA